METLQNIIDKRKFLTEEQQTSLISLLTFKTREAIKREIAAEVKFRFYNTFDLKWYSNRIGFKAGIAEYLPIKDRVMELAKVRLDIIGE